MEFYKKVENSELDINHLKRQLTIQNLPKLCASINSIIADEGNQGIIYCLWGEFVVNREELGDGIRFSLPKCPNALAWTITTDNEGGDILLHCTINKQTHDEDFIESINEFVTDWSNGLANLDR